MSKNANIIIKIDKDIPLPEIRQKFPLKEMKIGDSFFIQKYNSNISHHARKFDIKLTQRQWKNGFRIWRIG